VCFPSYERIAEKAECARSTVAEALRVLEWAGVLTWQHRITRIRERCRDLWGHEGWRWRVIRTSNAYVFREPKAAAQAGIPSKSENPTGTQNQDVLTCLYPLQPVENPPQAPSARRWSMPLHGSGRCWQQRMASNKAPAARSEPRTDGEEPA